MDLQHGQLPDPFSEAMRLILDEQIRLRDRLAKLESSQEARICSEEVVQRIAELHKMFENGVKK